MSENKQVPEGMEDADRIVREFVARVSEHVDSVQVFINKKRDDGKSGTWKMGFGAGNWYARYGQVREWLIIEDEAIRMEAHDEDTTG